MNSQEYFQPELVTIPLLPLNAFLQETVAFIFSTCTRVEKLTPHLHFLRDLCVLLFKPLYLFPSLPQASIFSSLPFVALAKEGAAGGES
jgi:hypothetical protein